ncbi:uncharacterized protein LOC124535892 [Vanessa cardui]|uniref:uncharacterized protein LOC124535892 n=1 Tax=Vanessa cardui TaxID=171605 RepID=UPI001F13338C|nr:uncharacterized protein LOC124535892 [Vanessa cardui]
MPLKEDNNSGVKSKSSNLRTLRILIVEPRGRYCRTVWCAIGVGIVHVLIGATIMVILIYSLLEKDYHAILCSAAYHFFSAEAILSLNYANGWSAPMRLRHRRLSHMYLQICAMICAISGTALILVSKGLSGSVHGVTGIITLIFAGITFLLGPFAMIRGRNVRLLHTSFGLPTFISSTICLCSGLFTSEFTAWAHVTTSIILIGFIVFYASFMNT